MKKILSIVLVLCMLFTGCFMLFSCATPNDQGSGHGDKKLTVEDLQNNPTLIAAGMVQAFSAFFDVADANSVIGDMDKGSVALIVDNAMLKENIGLGKTALTVYADTTDNLLNKLAMDVNVAFGDETYDGMFYVDKDGIGVASDAIFGSDDTYKVDIPNLLDNFKESYLKDMIGGEQAVDTVGASFTLLSKTWKLPFAETAKDSEDYKELVQWNSEALKKLEPDYKTETVDGVEAVVVTYKMNNETLEAYLEYVVENVPELFMDVYGNFASVMDLPEFSEDTLEEGKDIIIEALNSHFELDLEITVALACNGGALVLAEIKGDMAPTEKFAGVAAGSVASAAIEVEMALKASENALSVEMGMDAEFGEDMKMDGSAKLAFAKEEKDGKIVIKGDADVKANVPGMEEPFDMKDILEVEATYDKANGDLEVEIDINVEEFAGENISANLKGNISVKDGKVTCAIDSVSAAGFELSDLGVSIVIDPTATVPAVDEDAKEIMDLTEDEWKDLIENVESSPLVELIGSLGKSERPVASLYGTYSNDRTAYIFDGEGMFEMTTMGEFVGAGEYFLEGDQIYLNLEMDSEATSTMGLYNGDEIIINGVVFTRQY